MTYIAVAAWDSDGRITAENRAETEPAAQALVATMVDDGYSDAFCQSVPAYDPKTWVVVGGAITEGAVSAEELAAAKATRKAAIDAERDALLAAGYGFSGNTYQIGGGYTASMSIYMTAIERYERTKPDWSTSTGYTAGDIVKNDGRFYLCLLDHTSGVLSTDIGADKMEEYFLHPHLGGNGRWRDIDNANNALTTAEAQTLCVGALDYEARVHTAASAHKDAVDALSSIAAVTAYDSSTWPS